MKPRSLQEIPPTQKEQRKQLFFPDMSVYFCTLVNYLVLQMQIFLLYVSNVLMVFIIFGEILLSV